MCLVYHNVPYLFKTIRYVQVHTTNWEFLHNDDIGSVCLIKLNFLLHKVKRYED